MSSLESLLAGLSPERRRELLDQLDAGAAAGPVSGTPAASAAPAAPADRVAVDLTVHDREPRRLGQTEAPLSYAQQRLWFLHQLEPDNPAYHVAFRVDWPGPLDRDLLAAAFAALVDRYEVLRTRFPAPDGEPRQLIEPELASPIGYADLTGRPPDERGGELDRLCRQAANQPFDLANGPVVRLSVVRLGDQRYTLILALHHIVCDRWSVELLLSELAAGYAAGRDPTAAGPDLTAAGPGAAPAIQYADFASWQRARLAGGELDNQLAYWRQRLEPPVPPLDLPTDHAAGPGHRSRGATLRFPVADRLRDRLVRLGREHDATLFATLLTGFTVLLYRQTGQPDIAVNSIVSNRSLPVLETVPGLFLNTLVLRTDLAGAPTFAEALARVRDAVLGALAHPDVPYQLLVERFAPDRGSGGSPFTPVMFAFSEVRELPGGLTGTEIDNAGARSTLLLAVQNGPQGLEFGYEYDRDRYRPDTIERLHGHLTTLLTAAVHDPGRPVTELPLLTAAELAQIEAWNDTARPYPLHRGVAELVDEVAAAAPEAVALVCGDTEVSYGQLAARSNRLAHHLGTLGAGPGTRVAVYLQRCPDLVVALLGALKAGAGYLPLDPSYPTGRLAYLLADAAPPVLISTPELAGDLLRECPGPALVDLGTAELDRYPATSPARHPGPDAVAYVIYTSGSTGTPKGVLNTHRGLTNHTLWLREAFEVCDRDTVLQKTPIGFDVSLWELLVPLVAGARLVLAAPDGHRDPGYLARVIHDRRVTMVHFVPSMLRTFLEVADLSLVGSLRQVLCSGEALPGELVSRFFASGLAARLDNLYGPTEAAVHVTRRRCHPDDPVTSVSIGRVTANTRAYILDRGGMPVPVGTPGELCLGGVQVARGYLNRPDLTAAAFVPDPFSAGRSGMDRSGAWAAEPSGAEPAARMYRTGDLARWRRDGGIDYLGRRDHQVKLRGFRIELGEIEAALMAHPAVAEAAVLLREDVPGDPRLVAYLTPAGDRPAADPPVAQLRAALSRTLPAYMLPSAFVPVAAMPLSANGKVDRRALGQIAVAGPASPTAAADPPRDDVERALVALYQEILGCGRIGIRDDFFALGGHSLLATRLSARVRRDLGLDMPLRTFFDCPTVETLAVALTERAMAEVDPAELDALLNQARREDDG